MTLPRSLDQSAYRIIQEALTNTLRYARGAMAHVAVRYQSDQLELEVTNDQRDNRGRKITQGRPRAHRDARTSRRVRWAPRGWPETRRWFRDSLSAPAHREPAVRISVLLADDDELTRRGLRLIIESDHDLIVAGEAANGQEAIHLARAHQPDVVLMDIRMPDVDGLAATRQIVEGSEDGPGS
jgi:hypothetical protein